MGFTIYYRSTRPVAPAEAAAIERATDELCLGRTWLSCEPVGFFPDGEDGHLFGGSKPNFQPHPDDAAAAAREGLPDGTTFDMLDVLCQVSRDHGIDWEISHDHSDGAVGFIRSGVCDEEVSSQVRAFAGLGDILGDLTADVEFPGDLPSSHSHGRKQDLDDDDDDGPPILSFRPKGE